MARPLRFQYPGAIYHVMARGDGGRFIFETREDSLLFMGKLDNVCTSHGWRIHAWVLMGNHFHLLLETPEPNLVSGMRLLLGTFAQTWNRRRNRRGHVFQGRYKSIPVAGELASDAFQFRTVADYIHLNPVRAGIAGGPQGKLSAYEWSSLKHYAKRTGPKWLVKERVLKAFELTKEERGRRSYVNYLEQRAENRSGELTPEAMRALRRGWYLGDESFRDRLLALLSESAESLKAKGSHSPELVRGYDEVEAQRILAVGHKLFELPDTTSEDGGTLRKSDVRKVVIATVLKQKTSVSNAWIAEALGMGHPNALSRLISQGKNERRIVRMKTKILKML